MKTNPKTPLISSILQSSPPSWGQKIPNFLAPVPFVLVSALGQKKKSAGGHPRWRIQRALGSAATTLSPQDPITREPDIPPMGSLSPSSASSDLLLHILRKLQSLGFCRDLPSPESEFTPKKLSSFFNRTLLALFYQEIQRKDRIRPVPAMLGGGEEVDLYKLYFAVRERGGYESVSPRKGGGWAAVSVAIGFDSCVGPAVKLVYFKYLWNFERWMERVLVKKQSPKKSKAREAKKEAEGKKIPVSASKKNHFLTPVRDGGRRLKLDDDEKGGDGGGDVEVVEAKTAKRGVVVKRPLGSGSGYFNKRKRDVLVGMLDWIRRVAKSPEDDTIGRILPSADGGMEKGNHVGELYSMALSARRAMFTKIERMMNGDMLNMQKGQKMLGSIYEDSNTDAGNPGSEKLRYSPRLNAVNEQSSNGYHSEASTIPDGDMANGAAGKEADAGKRRERNSSSLSELDDFMIRLSKQEDYEEKKVCKSRLAVLPFWTDKSLSTPSNSNDLKWLGTAIWPQADQEHSSSEQNRVGKGRQDSCNCEHPGYVECIRFHVAEERVQLKRELGPAFNSWRFDCMGEEVALSWTEEEAQKFKTVVLQNPQNLTNELWPKLLEAFPSKGMKNLVSYYYNVFMLGRRSYQNRMTPYSIDSDCEEEVFGFLSTPFGQEVIEVHAPKSNFCAQNSQCVDIDD